MLDRLIDLEPRSSSDPARSNLASIAELKQSVRRDLEWLLNTRHSPIEIGDDMEEVQNSMAVYGLPDMTGHGVEGYDEQDRLTASVENAIRIFEPRFLNLRVTMLPISSVDRELKFRIEANLDVKPVPEAISFDTVLQMGRGEFLVKNS